MRRSLPLERREFVDDAILWLSLLSIAAICLVMLYSGVTGLAHIPDSKADTMKKAFAITVYILFIILPLLILSLMLDTTFTRTILERATTLLYIATVADIILMTVFLLLTWL